MILTFEGSVFWDIMKRSPVKVTRRFGGTCHLNFQSGSISQARNQHEATCFILLSYFAYSSQRFLLASCWLPAWHSLRPRRWKQNISPKRFLTFNGLQDVIIQETESFITTALIISNTTSQHSTMYCNHIPSYWQHRKRGLCTADLDSVRVTLRLVICRKISSSWQQTLWDSRPAFFSTKHFRS
jgi:hypothetical protein